MGSREGHWLGGLVTRRVSIQSRGGSFDWGFGFRFCLMGGGDGRRLLSLSASTARAVFPAVGGLEVRRGRIAAGRALALDGELRLPGQTVRP